MCKDDLLTVVRAVVPFFLEALSLSPSICCISMHFRRLISGAVAVSAATSEGMNDGSRCDRVRGRGDEAENDEEDFVGVSGGKVREDIVTGRCMCVTVCCPVRALVALLCSTAVLHAVAQSRSV